MASGWKTGAAHRVPDPAGWRILAAVPLAAAAAILTACSPGTPAPVRTAAVTQSPAPPASTPAPTPQTGTPAAGPGECPTASLQAGVTYQQGAAGTIFYTLNFRNISGTACVLQGYPGVSLVTAGNDAGHQIGADARRDTVVPVRPVTLQPGGRAHATLGVTQALNFPAARCQPVTAHWLKVFPPDQYTAAYVTFTVRTCASASVPTMRITAVSAGTWHQ